MADYQEIEITVDDPVGIVRMNRPKALNALTDRGFEELKDAFAALEADPHVVGIILTGNGRGFCAGYDFSSLTDTATSGAATPTVEIKERAVGDPTIAESFRDPTYLTAIRKPVIAAINGPAAGGGMVMALMCDIRIAGTSAVLAPQFPKLGLASEGGIAWILPKIVGNSKALDLLWSGRKVRAEEALQMGIVDRVVPDDQLVSEARAYIEGLAKTVNPWSLMTTKRMVYAGWNQTLANASEEADTLTTEAFTRSDATEGTMAFAEKRPAKFARLEFGGE